MEKLIINKLSKTYHNGIQALRDVSLEIPIGMYGLLGPNGAGKSTLMRTIATLQDADSGSVQFGNINVLQQKTAIRKVLGYLPQSFGLYPKITAEELLHHLAVLKGVVQRKVRREMVAHLLQRVNLYERRKQKLGSYSGGMKQRFGIAQALLNQPKLLIVDEPTAGLDPSERNRFFNLLSEISEETIVILSTHIVDDVKEVCTKMAIMKQGRVVVEGNPMRIMESLKDRLYKKTIPKNELADYQHNYRVISDRRFMGQTIIHIISDTHPGAGFETIDTNLEDVYMFHMLSWS